MIEDCIVDYDDALYSESFWSGPHGEIRTSAAALRDGRSRSRKYKYNYDDQSDSSDATFW
jgi:hypothetical protein